MTVATATSITSTSTEPGTKIPMPRETVGEWAEMVVDWIDFYDFAWKPGQERPYTCKRRNQRDEELAAGSPANLLSLILRDYGTWKISGTGPRT